MEAIELYRSLRPDVLLLDLRMPQKEWNRGSQRNPQGVQRRPTPHRDQLPDRGGDISGSEGRALGYILKDMGRETLIEAIRSVHGGKRWVSPAILNSSPAVSSVNSSPRARWKC